MTLTLCNFHPFTFYLPFHTSPPVDQCPIHALWAWICAPATHFLGAQILITHFFFLLDISSYIGAVYQRNTSLLSAVYILIHTQLQFNSTLTTTIFSITYVKDQKRLCERLHQHSYPGPEKICLLLSGLTAATSRKQAPAAWWWTTRLHIT